MTTRVVHVNDQIPDAVYIGRAMPRQGLKCSPFANPNKITGEVDRYQAVTAYHRTLTGPGRPLLALLPLLRDKPLACWCRHDGQEPTPETWCHGDVLIGMLKEYTDDELREMAYEDVAICRICGCTEEAACEGGCYWIEPNLCSACAKSAGIPPDEPEWRTRQRVDGHDDRLHELEEAVADLQAFRAGEGP